MKYLYLFIIIFICCTTNKNKHDNKNNEEIVTIILNNAPSKWAHRNDGSYFQYGLNGNLSYLDSLNTIVNYSTNKKNDTLTIPTFNKKHVEFIHKYNGSSSIYFLVEAGDTINITYTQDGFPMLNSKLSTQNNFLYNINFKQQEDFNYYKAETFISIKKMFKNLNIKFLADRFFEPLNIDSNFYNDNNINMKVINYLNNFDHYLDSLYKEKKLPKPYYLFYKHRNFENKLKNEQYTKNENVKYHKLYFNDSLINKLSYQLQLNKFLSKASKDLNVNMIKKANSIQPNYRTIFDNLLSNKNIPPKTKSSLLRKTLIQIINNSTIEETEKYTKKFLSSTGDSNSYNRLIKEYNLNAPKDQLWLKSINNEITTLNSLLKKFQNKMIYIDYWGSWCAPCCRAMKSAKELRREYKNKDIVFVYLAYNDKESRWRKTIEKLEMNSENSYNYLITNSKTSKYIEEMNISRFPRYMIFDKSGKLVHKNAPGPNKNGIRKLLNKYLK
jgi:thiol-disulfide isomerase/thioredoxin